MGYKKYAISPVNTRSIDSRLSSVSPIPIKSPVITSAKRKEHPDSISIIYERPNNNQNKHKQVHKNDETTIRSENRVYIQHQQRFKSITDVRFVDRPTPYPPDVNAYERIMMNRLQFLIND